MSESTSRRSNRGLDSISEAEDQIRAQRHYGNRTTYLNDRAKLVNALRLQREAALAAGVLPTALPQIHDNMSPRAISDAQTALNAYTPGYNGGGGATATGQVVARNRGQQPAQDGRQVAMPAPMVGGFAPTMLAGLDSAAPQSPFVRGVPTDVPQPSSTGDGALDRLAAERSGAGFSTQVQSQSGTRSVMIQPTGQQALNARFEGFSDMSPDQRRATLQANPASRDVGEVIDPGTSARNQRGERFVSSAPTANNPAGGLTLEVDPNRDFTMTRLDSGDPLLPQGADRGFLAPEKYADETGNRVASVSYGPRRGTGPVAFDERGAVDVSGNFDIEAARRGGAPTQPQSAPQQSPEKPAIQMPIDPASLARLDGGTQPPVGFQFGGMGETAAPKASPQIAAPAPQQSQIATTQAPAAPTPTTRINPAQVAGAMDALRGTSVMEGARQLGGPIGMAADMALRSPAVASTVSDIANAATMPKQTLRPMPSAREIAGGVVDKAQQFASTLPKQTIRPMNETGAIAGAKQAATGLLPKAKGVLSKVKDAILPPGNTIPTRQPSAAQPQVATGPEPVQPSPTISGRGGVNPATIGPLDMSFPSIPGPKTQAKLEEIRNRNGQKFGLGQPSQQQPQQANPAPQPVTAAPAPPAPVPGFAKNDKNFLFDTF